jgi:hypothetical protein
MVSVGLPGAQVEVGVALGDAGEGFGGPERVTWPWAAEQFQLAWRCTVHKLAPLRQVASRGPRHSLAPLNLCWTVDELHREPGASRPREARAAVESPGVERDYCARRACDGLFCGVHGRIVGFRDEGAAAAAAGFPRRRSADQAALVLQPEFVIYGVAA